MDELVGGFAPAPVQPVGFHQLPDLGLNGFFLGGPLALQVELAISFGFFLTGLARTGLGPLYLDSTLGMFLSSTAIVSADNTGLPPL